MKKTIVMFIAALSIVGCERSPVTGPGEIRPPSHIVQVVLVDGLGDNAGILTSASDLRVGAYFDFRPFDSLEISFRATRLTAEAPFDEILLRIGPTFCVRDSVVATQKDVSHRVRVTRISKNHYCALSFLTLDPRVLLQLSELRVVGWMLQ